MEPEAAQLDQAALADLVRALDAAVEEKNDDAVCRAVETALSAAIQSGATLVPAAWHETAGDHYARRLLHRDPQGRYTVISMTWGPGQGTPLHDHGDSWGTVCVYAGRIRVTPYTRLGDPDGDNWRFREEESVDAGRCTAASVIPPCDFHTIENPFEKTGMSIHVYKGEMETCGIYLPAGEPETYRREVKSLSYDPG